MPKLDALLARLKPVALDRTLDGPFKTVRKDAVRYPGKTPAWFIVPNVNEHPTIETAHTAVVLVSARAAVGKSTAAEFIAEKLAAPLWDLSKKLRVGHGFVAGTLFETYSPARLPDLLAKLAVGEFAIVIDALDEARLRGGTPNELDLLMYDVAARCGSAGRVGPSFVMLGRVDTCSVAAEKLTSLGIPFSQLEVQYFDESEARDFISRRLDSLGHTAHRGVQARDFEAAVDSVFDAVMKAMNVSAALRWDDDELRRFLGYAPVLVAIAVYLRKWRDYKAMKQDWDRKAVTGDQWQVLCVIMTALLEREQTEKFRPNVEGRITAKLKPGEVLGWTKLFGPDEQCTRVLERVTASRLLEDADIDVPNSARAEYELAATQEMYDHPLTQDTGAGEIGFASVVFQEYVYALQLLRGDPYAEAAAFHMQTSEYRPTPLLAGFIAGLSPGPSLRDLPMDAFGAVYESFTLHERPGVEVRVAVGTLDDTTRATITFWRVTGDEAEPRMERRLVYRLVGTGEPLHFLYKLVRTAITVDGDVIIGTNGSTFILGPSVDLACEEFVCQAGTVYVHATPITSVDTTSATSPTENVSLEFGAYGFGRSVQSVNLFLEPSGAANRFEVVSAKMVPRPWTAYYRKPTEDLGRADSRVVRAFTDMRSVFNKFYKSESGIWLIYKQFMDNVYAVSERKSRILSFLLQKSLIRDDGRIYRLDMAQLNRFGLAFDDIRTLQLKPPLVALLREFLAAE